MIGRKIDADPPNCSGENCIYGRKHVPWISFVGVLNGTTVEASPNRRFADFPSDYATLPTVAFVIPDLNHDMHNGKPAQSIPAGNSWLRLSASPWTKFWCWRRRWMSCPTTSMRSDLSRRGC